MSHYPSVEAWFEAISEHHRVCGRPLVADEGPPNTRMHCGECWEVFETGVTAEEIQEAAYAWFFDGVKGSFDRIASAWAVANATVALNFDRLETEMAALLERSEAQERERRPSRYDRDPGV